MGKISCIGFWSNFSSIYFAQQDPILSATGLNDIDKARHQGWSMILLACFSYFSTACISLQPRDLLNSHSYIGPDWALFGNFVMQPERSSYD